MQLVVDSIDAVGGFHGEQAFTIPAGGSLLAPSPVPDVRAGWASVIASAPVQIVGINEGSLVEVGAPARLTALAAIATVVAPPQASVTTLASQNSLDSLTWVWQTGTAVPPPQPFSVALPLSQPSTDYTISVATSSGGTWLSVSPNGTIHCQVGVSPNPCATLQAAVNPVALIPGNYRGTITITPVATAVRPLVEPSVTPVALTVTAVGLAQTVVHPLFPPNDNFVNVPTGFFTGPPAVGIFTDSGGNWVSASLDNPTSPTIVTVTANTARFSAGEYSAEVVVTGSGNTLVIPVLVSVPGSLILSAQPGVGVASGALTFAVPVGGGSPAPQTVPVSVSNCATPGQCVSVIPNDLSSVVASVQTHLGGNWLSASISQSQGVVTVSANPAALSAGTYLGAVTLTASGIAPTQFPVVLLVEGGPLPALLAGPAVVNESSAICITSASVPLHFTIQVSTSDGGTWLSTESNSGTTPACLDAALNPSGLTPGSYNGSIVITAGAQSVTIPALLTVAQPPGVPLLGAVVSAESTIPGALYPGEIVAIHGLNFEPAMGASGLSVLVGGIPASILYATPTVISAVVPLTVAGPSTVTVQVQSSSGSTAVWTMPLAPQPGVRPYHRLR